MVSLCWPQVSDFKTKLLAFSVCLLLISPQAENARASNDLLAHFAQQSERAHAEQINAEYLAGGSQVLYGDTLLDQGLQTVGEALSRLPGIQTLVTNAGESITVRGNVIDILQSDIQMRLNGVDIVAIEAFQPYSVLNIPLDVVARIEVIKGPGSARFGEYSQNGVINVVTLPSYPLGKVSAGLGANDSYFVGFNQQWQGDNWELNLALSTKRDKGDDGFITQDVLHTTSPAQVQASNAPGNADNRNYFDAVVLHFEHGNTRVDASYLETLQGDRWGTIGWLSADPRYKRENSVSSLQVSHDLSLADQRWRLQAGIQRYDMRTNAFGFPEGLVVPQNQAPFFSVIDRDLYQDDYAYIQRSYAGLRWQTTAIGQHKISVELNYHYLDVRDSGAFINYDSNAIAQGELISLMQPILVRSAPLAKWAIDSHHQNVLTLALEDQFEFSDKFRSLVGLRYDSRQKVWSPRVALLYELSASQRLNLQLAHAARTPTLNQEQVNPALGKESTLHADLSYTYDSAQWRSHISAYISQVKNKISPERIIDPNISFTEFLRAFPVNDPTTRRYRGLELSVDYVLGGLDTGLALSYTRGDGPPVQHTEHFISPWALDASLAYDFNDSVKVHLEQRFLSSRERVENDTRSKFASQAHTNINFTLKPFGSDELSLRLNVRNLFDRALRSPSGWVTANDYPDDFPLAGREVYASLHIRW